MIFTQNDSALPSKHPSQGLPVGNTILATSNIDLATLMSVSENAT
jgi:hypothetical protein